ncbi:MAG: hypothetical protein K9H26_07760 [Prolixibacteraceae bacterium]|nr:hypothetical protein [Prolixibacteraceae bacterium]
MQHNEKLEHGHFYHIYNHAVGGRYLFRKPENYHFFLGLYDKYIDTVAYTYAWVLMPNHFHFLVKIKSKEEIAATSHTPDRVRKPATDQAVTPDRVRKPVNDKINVDEMNRWLGI